MDLGAATLALAVLAFIAWLTYVLTRGPARPSPEPAPPNLEPYLTDDDLETNRLNRILIAALVTSGILAVVMPIYYLNESGRQLAAEHKFEEIALERGHEWFVEFECAACHGPAGGGGTAGFIEARSGIPTGWYAPPLNDVFYRYERDEVRHWIVFGRPGTPMPAWGVDGGGPMSMQQIDELLDYIESIQLSQADAFAQVEGRVAAELARLDGAEATLDEAIADQRAEIEAVLESPDRYAVVSGLPAELRTLLTGDGTCTARSAALYGTTCGLPGGDSDRDGLSDAAEAGLVDLIARLLEVAPPSDAAADLGRLSFDPTNPFTNRDGARPIPDLEAASEAIADIDQVVRGLRLTAENLDTILPVAERGLDFLLQARAARPYAFDFDGLAAEAFGGDLDEARRAAALYNAYCARCHTAGYSAGVEFTMEAGSGAFGPSLRAGRSVVQFPDPADHLDFLVAGSEAAVAYGVNGIGRGWMPGFGALLSEHDLMLIVALERSLP
jgi:mono/diheme cytochrome c family protein